MLLVVLLAAGNDSVCGDDSYWLCWRLGWRLSSSAFGVLYISDVAVRGDYSSLVLAVSDGSLVLGDSLIRLFPVSWFLLDD